MMWVHDGPEAEAFAVRFSEAGTVLESEEVAPGVVLDKDSDGQVVGVEVLDVRSRMKAERSALDEAGLPSAAE